MVGRAELTDKSWEWIAPLLPENGRRGGRWRDHRAVVNGILWKFRTGAPWRDLPSCYGPWQTCYDRFVRWRRDGTWNRLLAHAQTKSDTAEKLVLLGHARRHAEVANPLWNPPPKSRRVLRFVPVNRATAAAPDTLETLRRSDINSPANQ